MLHWLVVGQRFQECVNWFIRVWKNLVFDLCSPTFTL